MGTAFIRVLVVDDYEPWRRFFSTELKKQPELQIVGEASDGLQAVQRAQDLQPDLVLLDIGLPTLNGIEAARQIRKVSRISKILCVSENRSADIAEEALRTGASGYVLKSDAAELLRAIGAVLEGKRFVSTSLAAYVFTHFGDPQGEAHQVHSKIVALSPLSNRATPRHHEAAFYSDDRRFSDDVMRFIGAALKAGNAAIIVATKSHRESLLSRLQGCGVDIRKAIEQGRYIPLDATEALSTFMVDGMPDPERFMRVCGKLISTAAKAGQGQHPRVAIFAEDVQVLWEQGNVDAMLQIEQLSNKLAKMYDVDILCGYSLFRVDGGMDHHIVQQIRVEHSATFAL